MPGFLDRPRLIEAFGRLGADLAKRGLFIELAVYGGSAIMLQFDWRQSTEDVDAVVREGYDEAALAVSVTTVAVEMDLEPNWLNNAVGMFTPLHEDDTLFDISGSYPKGSTPGLRVLVAKPHYLLAMKLQALRSYDRGERDMADARVLAKHIGLSDEAALCDLYTSIQGEQPPDELRLRFRALLGSS